jgi:hypothetical protein
MEIVPSTLPALALALALFLRGPRSGLWLMLFASPFGAAAAFNLPAAGGATIGVLDLAAVAAFAAVLLMPGAGGRMLGTMRPPQPGFWLAGLMAVAVVSALFLPRLFVGETEVFSLSRAANERGIVSLPLAPTTGNLTQAFRLTLGALAFYALATVFRRSPDAGLVVRAIAVATAANLALGLLDLATFLTGTAVLLEPIRTANYAILEDVQMMGIKRMIGGFPEASAFGNYTLGLFGFWFAYWAFGPRRRLAGWMLGGTTLALLHSTSSAAYVGLVGFLVTFGLVAILANLRAQVGRRGLALAVGGILAAWLGAVAVFSAYALVDPVTAFLDRALFDKFETDSGVERMSWNAQALRNFADTWGLGAGLGSVRASSWLAACLGSIGLLGTGLYLAFLASLARAPGTTGDAERDASIAGLKAAALAIVLQAMLTLPTPDLGIFFFALAGLLTGLSRGGALERMQARPQGARKS